MGDWQFCPRCGAKLDEDAEVCRHCGAAMPGAPTVQSGDPPAVDLDQDLSKLEEDLRKALSPSYIVVRRLGAGGMGSVFLAREPALKRWVAVKVLAPTLAVDPGARARFAREAQAVARLSHPNIVAIHSVGELEDKTPYFVMQYVGGRSMAERVEEEGPLPSEEARQVIGEVASALATAHTQHIIHRDIKPANILYDDESGRVLVSDFGIAAVRPKGDEQVSTRLTQTGMAIGTPRYMSPEQLLAEEVTEKTDVYALGLFGYELLAGSGPFAATTPQELVAAHLRDTPRDLSEIVERIDPELESVVAACLSKKADDRPSAREIAQRLTLGADVLLEWPPPGLGRLRGALRPLTWLFATGSILAGVGFLSLLILGPELSSAMTSFATLTISLAGSAGIFTLFVAAIKLIRLAGAAARAVRASFGWLSIGETLADHRGDTGALIAGMREYAALPPSTRDRLRKGRLISALVLFAAAVLPVLLIVLLVRLSGAGPVDAPATVFVPSIVLLIVAAVVDRREVRTVGPMRARLGWLRGEKVGDPRIVSSWKEALDRVRRGQSLGSGPDSQPDAARIGSWLLTLAMLATVIVLTPIILVGVFGPVLWQIALPKFSGLEDRARVAEAVREFGVPADSTITPLEAGQAFYSLQSLGVPSVNRFPEHPYPTEFSEGFHEQPMADDLFSRAMIGPDGKPLTMRSAYVVNGPNHLTILQYARRGLSPGEEQYLEHLAALPQWDAWSTVARAPAMDYIAARFVLPFPDSIIYFEMPIPKFAMTKEAAYASVSRAALYLAQGGEAEAEATLRETISVGFKLVDGRTLIESLIGVVVVSIGREALIEFYTLTARPEGRVLRARVDSANAFVEGVQSGRSNVINYNDMGELRVLMLSTINDRGGGFRSLPIELLNTLSFAPCTNVYELLFGPHEDITLAIERVRRDLASFESERQMIDMIADTPRRGRQSGGGVVGSLGRFLGRTSGVVLGNDRIAGCVNWLTDVSLLSSVS